MANVTCDTVVIGKLQETCRPIQVNTEIQTYPGKIQKHRILQTHPVKITRFGRCHNAAVQDAYERTNKGFAVGVLTPIILTTGILLYIWIQVEIGYDDIE